MSDPSERTPRAVLEQALRVHRAELSAFVRSRVHDSEADDVLQLATLRAAEHIADLDDAEKIRPWLFRIVRNAIVDAKRASDSRQRLVQSGGQVPEVEAPVTDATCRCSVQLAQTLSSPESTILSLVDLGEASLTEAAAALHISVNNATVRLHRARKALRERLREHCGVSSSSECRDCCCVYDGCCGA
jgi:RNA polymerase sigma-70 factor (ECF subfamily)